GESDDNINDSETDVISAAGVETDTPIEDEAGVLQQAWSQTETTSQADASGNQIGTVTTTTNSGSDTETEANGVVSDPGAVTSQPTSTPAAATSPPPAPTIPGPGELLTAAQNNGANQAGTPPNGNSSPPQSENAIQDAIVQLQLQI